jgi:predicted AAA+ superfamily ATPase
VNQLWPLSYDEVCTPHAKRPAPRNFLEWEPDTAAESDETLLRLGGFPQPFLRGSEQFLRRWQEQYLDRLVKEDVRDFANVQRIDRLELLTRVLPERLCSPVSIKGLAEDVEVSPVAIKSWLRLLEQLYFGFFVAPYHRKLHRAVKREKKWYFYQWTYAQNEAARLENYVAVQLGLACSAWSEQGYGRWELHFLRDQDRREVDFLITNDLKPVALIEVKSSSPEPTSALRYYSHKLNIPGFLITRDGGPRKYDEKIWSMGTRHFLKGLL